MALGSTSSAEKADGAGAAGKALALALLLASPPMPPTDEGGTDEYGMEPVVGTGTALPGFAGLAAGALEEVGDEAGTALPIGGMALPWLTGACRLVLPAPLGAGDVAAGCAALGALALRLA